MIIGRGLGGWMREMGADTSCIMGELRWWQGSLFGVTGLITMAQISGKIGVVA